MLRRRRRVEIDEHKAESLNFDLKTGKIIRYGNCDWSEG
jgi:ribosomal protein L32